MITARAPTWSISDASHKNTQPGKDKLPHHTDPIIALIAKDDLAMTAGQSLQFNSTETINFINAGDSQTITGGQWRIHAGQAIGLTTGGLKKNATAGLQLITAKGDTIIQAHSDEIDIKARDGLSVKSAQSHIDFAAAKSITLRTAGGASITISGGNITTQCPGKILINAGQKSFAGGTSLSREMNTWPSVKFDEEFVLAQENGRPIANMPFEIIRGDGFKIRGVTDAAGKTGLQKSLSLENISVRILPKAST